jgi:HK97 family phage prohead protease
VDRLILREDLEDAPPTVAGRTLTIRICTYNRVYRVGQVGRTVLRERVLPGAFREPLARPRGALRFRHIGERPGDVDSLENFYGVLTGLREEGDAVVGDFEVFEGPQEDKLLRLVESGAVTGASMTAVVKGDRKSRDAAGPVTDITRIGTLDAVSITPKPAYADAGVIAVREQLHTAPDPQAAARRAERIAAERAALAQLRAKWAL